MKPRTLGTFGRMLGKHTAKVVFKLRHQLKFIKRLRSLYWRMFGMKVGRNTPLPRLFVTWPHQVSLGSNCKVEHDVYFHYDGVYKSGPSIVFGDNVFLGCQCEFNIRLSLTIGEGCLIASGCRFIDHDHGFARGNLIGTQAGVEKPIKIGSDVWIGCNSVILKGVSIGAGAIVGAGSVVTRSIPEYEIWAGVPAKRIGQRK